MFPLKRVPDSQRARLITSDGIPISRKRINTSESNRSNSKPRRGGLASSVERFEPRGGSKALIHNFLGSVNCQNSGSRKNSGLGKYERSVDLVKGPQNPILANSGSVRKSHDTNNFPRMFSEEPKGRVELISYKERRNCKLRERSSNRSEKSQGRLSL